MKTDQCPLKTQKNFECAVVCCPRKWALVIHTKYMYVTITDLGENSVWVEISMRIHPYELELMISWRKVLCLWTLWRHVVRVGNTLQQRESI